MSILPRGRGVYLESGPSQRHVTYKRRVTVARLRTMGLQHAMIWVEAPDGRTVDRARALALASDLAAAGIDPHFWSFPAPDRAQEAAVQLASLVLAATMAGIPRTGGMLDAERLPPHRRRGGRQEHWEARDLRVFAETYRAHAPGAVLGLTSYPIRHSAVDLEGAGDLYDYGQPQCYRTAFRPSPLRRSHEYWGSHFDGRIVPAVPSFLDEMGDAIASVAEQYGTDACTIWSYRSIDSDEADQLAMINAASAAAPGAGALATQP